LLLQTKLQFNPDYYRIINLEEEESKDEKYGFEAQGSDQPSSKSTQPRLEFPVRE
jgi:hypothetical protein